MLGFQRNQRPNKQARGTVLILVVALLVILGLLATTFVLLSHADRASSRSLSRADRFEQVRQMSLAYVRVLLLKDLIGDDGTFLNGDGGDEAYDAPGDDPWLASQGTDAFGNWPFISNILAENLPEPGGYTGVNPDDLEKEDTDKGDGRSVGVDTNGDDVPDARWIPDDIDMPLMAPDGTKYLVAIRIVDTNGLANINVGMADTAEPNGAAWDGRYPCYLDLRSLRDSNETGNGSELDTTVSVPGRIPNYSPGTDVYTALTNDLYPYLANPNPPAGSNYVRPFDIAEELALRMWAGPGVDLHSRFGALWPETFGSKSDLLTAYSWTMQIRPPAPVTTASEVAGSEIEDQLAAIGYPGPAKVGLTNLTASIYGPRAAYLALLAAGLQTDEAAQFLVNLIDYIDNDNDISVIGSGSQTDSIRINSDEWVLTGTLASKGIPSKDFYGTDSQPIISEIFSYRFYQGTGPDVDGNYAYTLVPDGSRYAVELFNPTEQAIDLSGWKLEVVGIAPPYNLPNISIPPRGFLTLVSHNDIVAGGQTIPGLVITMSGGVEQTVNLWRPGPAGSTDVVVDRFKGTFAGDPGPDKDLAKQIIEDSQRPGRPIPFDEDAVAPYGDLIPVIAPFSAVSTTTIPTLGTNPGDEQVISTLGQGGQIILRNGPLYSLAELFYVPKVAGASDDGTGTGPKLELIPKMENQADGDSVYRMNITDAADQRLLQYLTLRTGLNDRDFAGNLIDNDGVEGPDNIMEARVPGLININTAPLEVLKALHYYYGNLDLGGGLTLADRLLTARHAPRGMFKSVGDFASFWSAVAPLSKDENPDNDGVGSPDGVTVDNEQKMFHFANVANLITVRSDVFVVYITIQASDKDGIFQPDERIMRTMAIVDRSYCLVPNGTEQSEIPLPRILAQVTLP